MAKGDKTEKPVEPAVVDPAPAAETAPAAAPASTDAPEAAATDVTTSEPEAAPEAPAFPGADEFGWDEWDGKVDALPDPVRAWAEKLAGHYQRAATEKETEANFVRTTYEALLAGRPDPRIEKLEADLAAKVKELEGFTGTTKEWEKKVAAAEEKAQQVQQAWDTFVNEQADAQAKAYAEKHPWMFENEEVSKLAGELFEEGFGMDDVPVILRMPDAQREQVRVIFKDLAGAKNAGQHAIALARGRADIKMPTSAELVEAGSRVVGGHEPLDKVHGDTLATALNRVVDLEIRRQQRS